MLKTCLRLSYIFNLFQEYMFLGVIHIDTIKSVSDITLLHLTFHKMSELS